MQNSDLTIILIASAGFGKAISGGDRIFLEFARYWKNSGCRVIIFTAQEGKSFCVNNGLGEFEYNVIKTDYTRFNFAYAYLLRIFRSINRAKKISLDYNGNLLIYSASDFLADSLPASILKKRFPRAKWLAGFYFFAPVPFPNKKDIQYRGGYALPTFKSFIYYLLQKIALKKILQGADLILVSNQLDRELFKTRGFNENNCVPLYGGVNLKDINDIPDLDKKYDACFVGRLHYQKGAMELVKIWNMVTEKKADAKMALIGEGPLKDRMIQCIKRHGLEKNIDMLGFVNGASKYRIFKSSKLFLHPPILDTGGMAAAEAMAAGLPVVGFDLPGYKYCYPKGMLKAPIGDLKQFAGIILDLLEDETLYNKMKNEALEFSREWDWGKKAEMVLGKVRALYEN